MKEFEPFRWMRQVGDDVYEGLLSVGDFFESVIFGRKGGNAMAKAKVYISFDFDHDESLKHFLVGQSKNEDSPFEISDVSIKEEVTGNWKTEARSRIKRAEQVAVICGEHTDTAAGVGIEVEIAQGEKKPYFLLRGYSDKTCKKPRTALSGDKMYDWTWNNLKILIGGGR